MQRRSRFSRSSSAEEVAGSIDILSEIFFRLPAKSRVRFKCVCKQWLSLLSDPQLWHPLHHHICSPSALLVSDRSGPSTHFFILPLIPTTTSSVSVRILNLNFLNHPNVSVVRSCNGLLLCHSNSTYFVCNPTTKKSLTLTFPFTNQPWSLYLAFDPSVSPHYQLVCIQILHSHNLHRVSCIFHVYSSQTRSWTHPGVSFAAASKAVTVSGVYCNRAIYWCDDAEISVYFDVDGHCLKSWPMPLSRQQWCNRTVEYFGECGGRLHMILGKKEQPLEFDVFEVNDDYSGWSLRHRVDLNHGRLQFPELHWDWVRFSLPFYIVCKVKEENAMLVLLLGGVALSCNLLNRTWTKLCDFKPGMTMVDAMAAYMSGEVFPYFENFSFV